MLVCDEKLCHQPAGFGVFESAQLRLLPPLTVHFKIRVLTFTLVLWGFLADAGLSFDGLDIGAEFLRGQGLSWSWFRF